MEMKLHMIISLCLIALVLYAEGKKSILQENLDREDYNLQLLLQDILVNNLRPYKCIVIVCDSVYVHIFRSTWFQKFELFISYFLIFIEENEDMYSPFPNTNASILTANKEGCQAYIIFVANGIQVTRFLMFGDKYRVIDTRAKFVMLYDQRLFQKPMQYLWKRIINVVFIRQYDGSKTGVAHTGQIPWYEITTVPFPSAIGSIFVPRRLDIWRNSKFRSSADLFRDKTSDIRNQTLKVVVFTQIPAVAKVPASQSKTVRTLLGSGPLRFSGLEIELLEILSQAMNFAYDVYETDTEVFELWGTKEEDGGYSGLFGEMVENNADVALGNLYYTQDVLNIMDLTIPYHTECITFLTPESLTDNSWKTLILPFKPLMWAAVVICLLMCGVIFYWIARFHFHVNHIKYECMKKQKELLKRTAVMSVSSFPAEQQKSDSKYTKMREQFELKKFEGQPEGIYLFGEMMNSLLYTYSMLLLVSIPKLPTGWSLRMLTGWYWLYCTLVVVAYRASMTAILASPSPRVTIDTLQQLVDSHLPCGGWGEINREFFKTSLDPTSQIIGSHFEMINSSDNAVERVAEGKFAFYENIYFLQEIVVKRQISHIKTILDENNTQVSQEIERVERNLHIMSDCVIKMPISVGLQKNSPMKRRMDKFIRRTVEAGLITKWLNDVMQSIVNANVQSNGRGVQAVMNIRKFSGAVVALLIGYICGIIALAAEIIYFNCYVKKHPDFDKYSKSIQRKIK